MVCQNNFKSLLAMVLLFSMSSFALATTYLPPAVSLERKSLRIINMHGTVGLPKGQWEMFIQHRFGTFGDGAYNCMVLIKVTCASAWTMVWVSELPQVHLEAA